MAEILYKEKGQPEQPGNASNTSTNSGEDKKPDEPIDTDFQEKK